MGENREIAHLIWAAPPCVWWGMGWGDKKVTAKILLPFSSTHLAPLCTLLQFQRMLQLHCHRLCRPPLRGGTLADTGKRSTPQRRPKMRG